MRDKNKETRLARWRKVEGVTLAEVAGLTGFSTAMLSLVERGRKSFAPKTKLVVARRLGVPVHELFEIVP